MNSQRGKRWPALLLMLSGGYAAAQTQQLNMSHDLVSLGIASQNLAPNAPSLDARPLFQAAVQYVASHPVSLLTLDQGSYYFLTTGNANAVSYVNFSSLSGLTVDLAGSTFYRSNAFIRGFQISQCSSLTLTNFQMDFLNPPYTHVQIASVNAGERSLAYQTLAGWPDPSSFNGVTTSSGFPDLWAVAFRNGDVVPGTTRMAVNRPIANGTLALTQNQTPWTQSATLATLQPGDIVAVTERGGLSPIYVSQSDSITLSNIAIYGASQFALQVDSSSNSTADHVKVMPRPGTGLIGSNADGIHFTSLHQNNRIQNCYVTRTLDDALAMNSGYQATVVSQTGPQQLLVTRTNYNRFPNGTLVNFVYTANTEEIAGATIVSQVPPDSSSPADNGQVTLTFNQPLPTLAAGDGMVFATPEMRGSGSAIQDNIAEDIPFGRGVYIGGAQGITVQRNVLRETSNAGTDVSQVTTTSPGPPSHDITIQSNAYEGNLGPMASGSGTEGALAAIIVVSLDQAEGFASAAGNTNVSILNNYIAGSGRSGVWVGETNGGTIENNLVIRWYQYPELPIFGVAPKFASQVTQDFSSPIVVHYSSGIVNQNNTTSMTSPISAPVVFTPSSAAMPAAGGSGSVVLSPSLAGFSWNAVASDAWIAIDSPTPGSGPATISYTVSPNAGAARTGSIVAAGETFTIRQAGKGGRRRP
jgi:hypothetical protein